ncbi:MAG: helix-turn-helix domain-containing protein [Roseburia sp.]|nr:helix-turn-helix domain-containing protein [Roseburia sp.]
MYDTDYSEIGHRIMNLRRERKISREKLARMAKISQKFLYEIEFGRKGFTVNTLKHIADSLETTCDYIVRGDDKYYNTDFYNAVNLFEDREIGKVADILKAVHELNV